jgi:hypothetical protein
LLCRMEERRGKATEDGGCWMEKRLFLWGNDQELLLLKDGGSNQEDLTWLNKNSRWSTSQWDLTWANTGTASNNLWSRL